jgi:hypothetical protein
VVRKPVLDLCDLGEYLHTLLQQESAGRRVGVPCDQAPAEVEATTAELQADLDTRRDHTHALGLQGFLQPWYEAAEPGPEHAQQDDPHLILVTRSRTSRLPCTDQPRCRTSWFNVCQSERSDASL